MGDERRWEIGKRGGCEVWMLLVVPSCLFLDCCERFVSSERAMVLVDEHLGRVQVQFSWNSP